MTHVKCTLNKYWLDFVLAAYFKEPGSAYLEELEETVMTLQADKDRDVRFFASLDPNMMLMDTSALI